MEARVFFFSYAPFAAPRFLGIARLHESCARFTDSVFFFHRLSNFRKIIQRRVKMRLARNWCEFSSCSVRLAASDYEDLKKSAPLACSSTSLALFHALSRGDRTEENCGIRNATKARVVAAIFIASILACDSAAIFRVYYAHTSGHLSLARLARPSPSKLRFADWERAHVCVCVCANCCVLAFRSRECKKTNKKKERKYSLSLKIRNLANRRREEDRFSSGWLHERHAYSIRFFIARDQTSFRCDPPLMCVKHEYYRTFALVDVS